MDEAHRGRLSAMLVVFGVLGLIVAAALLPYGLAVLGLADPFPSSVAIGPLARGPALLVAGALSALFFVAGRRIDFVYAASAVLVAIGYIAIEWMVSMAFLLGPGRLFSLVLVLEIGTALISALALTSARAVKRENGVYAGGNMDEAHRGRLSAMLVVFGVLGLIVAAALLPHGLAALGLADPFPSPLAIGLLARGSALLVAGAVSALFFVAGRRIDFVYAASAVLVAIGYIAIEWMLHVGLNLGITGGPTTLLASLLGPRTLWGLVLMLEIGTAIVSVLALTSARAVKRGGDRPVAESTETSG